MSTNDSPAPEKAEITECISTAAEINPPFLCLLSSDQTQREKEKVTEGEHLMIQQTVMTLGE